MNRSFPAVLHTVLVTLAALTLPSIAGPVTFIERSPADPARITVEVDQAALAGPLDAATLAELVEAGRQLFDTKFSTADGVGRPRATQAAIPTHFKHAREVIFQRTSGPESNRCSSCHNDPAAGGAGDFTVNAFTSEGTESADFDNVDPQFSNERGTNHMFGAGLMELLAREMTADLHLIRTMALTAARNNGTPQKAALTSKGVDFGSLIANPDGTLELGAIEGIDPDLVIRPFSQKGTIPSLRAFTVGALNAHHGIQADERFGPAMTGEADFDGDGYPNEFSPGRVSALIAYQATLPAPTPLPFKNPGWQAAATRGAVLFDQTGCTVCHTPSLPLANLVFADPGPFNTAGTLSSRDVAAPALYDLGALDWVKALPLDAAGNVLVPIFGDLKRHVIADARFTHFANELQGQGFVARDSFMTAELWGIADTAPYGHRGDLTDLSAVIEAHGGEARAARDSFAGLSGTAKADLITYLMSLRMPR